MAWRAARSLLTLHKQLKTGSRAAPPATKADEWGLIGDAAHDPTSDHTPHNFPGWGNQIVTAADFPNRPDLGLDAHRVLDDIRRSRDARVKYGISNGQMFSSYPVSGYAAWAWRPYNPKNGDKHFTHGHLSVVGDARADGTKPWATIGAPAVAAATRDEDDDMGASLGPITINVDGTTSLNIPPVQDGAADPRRAWFNANNDTGNAQYALRLWLSKGAANQWEAFPGTGDKGLVLLNSGQRYSVELPKGTSALSITRSPVGPGPDVYRGHLTCCIERGPVIPASA
ncbi:hypothetical protein [Dactylosporangium sp. CA-139066]|uniref:hypothetical protein n=1 Tax=Dactylosporangium sp. CA-139066 TaxID=3239930 RepID=UPI003D90FBD4